MGLCFYFPPEQNGLALDLIWRVDLVQKGPKMAPGVNDVILPIVCPGVERDVPSGEGWNGCWTFVRMILHSKYSRFTHMELQSQCLSLSVSLSDNLRFTLYISEQGGSDRTDHRRRPDPVYPSEKRQTRCTFKVRYSKKLSELFCLEWSCKQSMKSQQFTSIIVLTALSVCVSVLRRASGSVLVWMRFYWSRL